MNYNRGKNDRPTLGTGNTKQLPTAISLLDKMVDFRELESLTMWDFSGVEMTGEIRRSIEEIEKIRNRPLLCFVGNTVNPTSGYLSMISDQDELPFDEMVRVIDPAVKAVDIVLVTSGGSAATVATLVDKLRPRFDHVGFIILDKAMSAGTIFAMSGDEIIMRDRSKLGPIDPQIPRPNGTYLPAQGILALIQDIQKRGQEKIIKGEQIDWTDRALIQAIDKQEMGKALTASQYSISMVQAYLNDHKFKDWKVHRTNNPGTPVTPLQRAERAAKIAAHLCNHAEWKDHGHAINRNALEKVCQLEVLHPETVVGLDKAMRRMWALFYWLFENKGTPKAYISKNYAILRTVKEK